MMNLLYLSYSYLRQNLLHTFVNILLIALGVGMVLVMFLSNRQLEQKLTNDLQGINMVIGAKGSPLQIILSAVYHVDFPTGNIKLQDVAPFQRHPLVAEAIPMGLGDSYKGFRIVGTTTAYPQRYKARLATGKWWQTEMQVCIGSNVAQKLRLKVGDKLAGGHGLAAEAEAHEHLYEVVGIMQPTQTVLDDLLLTAMESIWHVHEGHNAADVAAIETTPKEITALLLTFKSPMAAVMLPRQINATTNLQAAAPAIEMARLFNLIGLGADVLSLIAYLVIFIAFLSMFVVFYKALKERQYDLAVMRSLGASASKVVVITLTEGILLAAAGGLLGCLLAHTSLWILATYLTKGNWVQPFEVVWEEAVVVVLTTCLGVVAALLPAVQAYRLQVVAVLRKQ